MISIVGRSHYFQMFNVIACIPTTNPPTHLMPYCRKMSWATKIVAVLFIAYIAQSLHVFYDIFHYKQCNKQLDAQYCIDVRIHLDERVNSPAF